MIVLRDLTEAGRKTLAILFKETCAKFYSSLYTDRWRAAWTLLLDDQKLPNVPGLAAPAGAAVREHLLSENLWLFHQWLTRRVVAIYDSKKVQADQILWAKLIAAQAEPNKIVDSGAPAVEIKSNTIFGKFRPDDLPMHVGVDYAAPGGEAQGTVSVPSGKVSWHRVAPPYRPKLTGNTYHIGGMLRQLRLYELKDGVGLSVEVSGRGERQEPDVFFLPFGVAADVLRAPPPTDTSSPEKMRRSLIRIHAPYNPGHAQQWLHVNELFTLKNIVRHGQIPYRTLEPVHHFLHDAGLINVEDGGRRVYATPAGTNVATYNAR